MKTNLLPKIALLFAILCNLTSCLEIPKTDSDTYEGITWTYNFDTHTLNFKGYGVIEHDLSEYNDTFRVDYCFYKYLVQKIIIEDDRIYGIGKDAFRWFSALTSVVIPNKVTSIGEQAFCGCSSLTSLTIPNSVTSIGNYAFSDCGLTTLTIPNSVTSIGRGAFSSCSLTSLTLSNSITSIGEYAFEHYKGLTSLTIPYGIKGIGNYAFCYCSNLR